MLEEVDELTSDRHRAETRLRTVSVWVGELPDDAALSAYLSPDDPSAGGFVTDIGEEWYDHDALHAEHLGDRRQVADIISGIASEIGLPGAAASALVERLHAQQVTSGNVFVLLHGHTYDEDGRGRDGLAFAGTVDYLDGAPDEDVEEAVARALARPVLPVRGWHLLVGETTARTAAEFHDYAQNGGFVADMGGEERLDVASLERDDGIMSFSHGLDDDGIPLSPSDFLTLPELTAALTFAASDIPLTSMAKHGIERVNAMLAFDAAHMRKLPARRPHLGLIHIGVHRLTRLQTA